MRLGLWSRVSLRLWAFVLAVTLAAPSAGAQGGQAVDLELALLVDVSASVSDEEYHLQAAGIAASFRNPAVLEVIRSVARTGIAVSLIQWADGANQRIAIGWTHLRNESDALWLAARIESMPRLIHGGHTALGSALAFALQELESNDFVGLRRVIDLSGDGRTNDGRPLRSTRKEVIERGITINGLAILNELPLLDDYFRDYLIGGEGAFYMVAQDYSDFGQAMIEKLVREIGSAPLSHDVTPTRWYETRAKSFPTAYARAPCDLHDGSERTYPQRTTP
jgi:hypothetical protein